MGVPLIIEMEGSRDESSSNYSVHPFDTRVRSRITTCIFRKLNKASVTQNKAKVNLTESLKLINI
jgi:hypothetical protein